MVRTNNSETAQKGKKNTTNNNIVTLNKGGLLKLFTHCDESCNNTTLTGQ